MNKDRPALSAKNCSAVNVYF